MTKVIENDDLRRVAPGFRALLVGGASAIALAMTPAFAQDSGDDIDLIEEDEEVVVESSGDTVVVTGSRLRRDEFTTVKPVQVISGEVSREIGLFDPAEILTESTTASGLQVDTTFSGFVSDNGPGSSTIDLRGLGASRNLVLLNGRRLGASGVEGAPGLASVNVIPASLIERSEILLDGASSVYGSDAVAGVINVILRDDFDGFELDYAQTFTEDQGGEEQRIAALWGTSNDRGSIGFAAEYRKIDSLKLTDRDYFGDCDQYREETIDGEIRTLNVAGPIGLFDQTTTDCVTSFGINRIFINPLPNDFSQFGSVYYTPGSTNVGIPNFSELGLFGLGNDGGVWFDASQDDIFTNDVDAFSQFYQVNGSPQDRDRDVIASQEFVNIYATGEYELNNGVKAFFEAGVSNRQLNQRTNGSRAFFPTLPSDNPFNPCNPNGIRFGIDCGDAFDNAVIDIFGAPLAAFGLNVDRGPRPVEAQVRVNFPDGDRVRSEITQWRAVGGFTGDLVENPIVSDGYWEVFASYDRSTGTSERLGFNDDRLALSLQTTIEDPNNPGNFICGLDIDGDGIPDPGAPFPAGGSNTAPDCVAVDPLAPSLFAIGGGDFATQAEFDYLVTNRTFETIVEQTVVGGIVGGNVLELPAGDVAALVGFEYRYDEIESIPDFVAREGIIFGFFSDRGANGARDLFEVFGETEVPILRGKPFAEELTLNASVRYTDESNVGSDTTYSISGNYRPNDFLTIRGSYGTSFRAPNLQEQFITGQSGFLSVTDPCIVPENAQTGLGVYDPALDTREQIVLDNCVAAGVDPTSLGLARQNQSVSIEVFTAGAPDNLKAETSTSWTAGFVFEQPWTDFFDATFGATYYDIEVEDTLVTTGTGFILDECYETVPNQQSPLCPLIRRDTLGFLSEVDTPFVNQDAETAKGIDFNLLVEKDDILLGGRELALSLDVRANNTLERESTVSAPGFTPVTDDLAGEPYFPEWNGQARLAADYGDFRFTWNTRYVGEQDLLNGEDVDPDIAFSETTDTCDPSVTPGLLCRDIFRIDEYFRHDVSVRYNRDTWTVVVGVNNVFYEEPPLVDGNGITEISGTNIPFNYDIVGRRLFVNLSKDF